MTREWHCATQVCGARHKDSVLWAGETDCWRKWLVCKHEDWSSDPSIYIRARQVWRWLFVIPVHGRQRRGILEGNLARLARSGSSGCNWRLCLNKKVERDQVRHPTSTLALQRLVHTHVYTPSYTCKHVYTHHTYPNKTKEWYTAFVVILWTLNTIYPYHILGGKLETRFIILGQRKCYLSVSVFSDK